MASLSCARPCALRLASSPCHWSQESWSSGWFPFYRRGNWGLEGWTGWARSLREKMAGPGLCNANAQAQRWVPWCLFCFRGDPWQELGQIPPTLVNKACPTKGLSSVSLWKPQGYSARCNSFSSCLTLWGLHRSGTIFLWANKEVPSQKTRSHCSQL